MWSDAGKRRRKLTKKFPSSERGTGCFYPPERAALATCGEPVYVTSSKLEEPPEGLVDLKVQMKTLLPRCLFPCALRLLAAAADDPTGIQASSLLIPTPSRKGKNQRWRIRGRICLALLFLLSPAS